MLNYHKYEICGQIFKQHCGQMEFLPDVHSGKVANWQRRRPGSSLTKDAGCVEFVHSPYLPGFF